VLEALVRLNTEQCTVARRFADLMAVRDKVITELRSLKNTNEAIEGQMCLLHSTLGRLESQARKL
jgi:hypothetical protein